MSGVQHSAAAVSVVLFIAATISSVLKSGELHQLVSCVNLHSKSAPPCTIIKSPPQESAGAFTQQVLLIVYVELL